MVSVNLWYTGLMPRARVSGPTPRGEGRRSEESMVLTMIFLVSRIII